MPLMRRLLADVELLRAYVRRGAPDFAWLFRELGEWGRIIERWGGRPIAESRVFEIGFGARPYRLQAMLALGADAYGVDAEEPLLGGGLANYRAILRANGWERLAKTLVRHALFDPRERAAFRRALARNGLTASRPESRRLLIGDAAYCEPPGRFDLIYSVSVFEHIERSSLEPLVARMASWLAPDGLALIMPDVFTGLQGGHLLEWEIDLALPVERRAEPWEHLRKQRYVANTTLNKLTRGDYTEILSEHFEILELIDPPRGLAAGFLTPEIREELAQYTVADLLDETPVYVLRTR